MLNHIKQLIFLYQILSLADDDPVKLMYQQQHEYPYEKNWATNNRELRIFYELPTDDNEVLSTTSASLITLETEDRYMHGKGKFIFEGLEKIAGAQVDTSNDKREERSSPLKFRGHRRHRTLSFAAMR